MDIPELPSVPCIFCEIASHEAAAYILYEDEEVIAFLDKYPITEGHTLVLPKQHYSRFDEVPEPLIAKIFRMVQKFNGKIRESMNSTAAHISINDGVAANQLVPHTHVHIIPRRENDDASFASRKRLSPEQMEEIQKRISL